MKELVRLRAEKARLCEELTAFAASEEFEQAKYDEMYANITKVNARISALEKAAELEASMPAVQTIPARDENEFAANANIEVPTAQMPRWVGGLGTYAGNVMQSATGGRTSEGFNGYINAANRHFSATGQNMTIGSEGRFLIPAEVSTAIWDRMGQSPMNLMSFCDTYTVTGESLTFNASAETSRADGYIGGGVAAYWISEASQMASHSTAKFRQIKLEPKELYVITTVTDKLLRNTTALDQYLNRKASDAIMLKVNDAILNGTGAGQPLGIIPQATGTKGVISVAKETGQAADTITATNINKMWARLDEMCEGNARWLYNRDCSAELDAMSMAVGTGGQLVYTPPGGISGQRFGTLKGAPAMSCPYCQSIGDLGDIVLGDFSYYALGVKGGIQSAMSMHLYFDYAKTAFRFLFEVDGQPWLNSAITPVHGSTTTAPFIVLAAR